MILEMRVGNILIDKAEPDFRFADTMVKREETIDDLKSYLYKQNFEKAFISAKNPVFVLLAESKVNEIIRNGIDENDIKKELMQDHIDNYFMVEKSLNKLNRWMKN